MPPPPAVTQPYYESPRPQPAAAVPYPTPQTPVKTPIQSEDIPVPTPLSEPLADSAPVAEPEPAVSQPSPTPVSAPELEPTTAEPVVEAEPEPEVTPTEDIPVSASENTDPTPSSLFVYWQMGTISTSEPTASTTDTDADAQKLGQWAIWSRRPQNPTLAPGIIISPRAAPPPNIVLQALDIKTPPVSVPVTPTKTSSLDSAAPSSEQPPVAAVAAEEVSSEVVWSSQPNSTAPSSSESEHTPTVPGSPASSNTSLSATATNKDAKDVVSATLTKEPDAPSVPVIAEPEVVAKTQDEPAAQASDIPATGATPTPSDTPTTPTPETPAPTTTTTAPTTTASTTTASTTTAPSQPPIKKSWASLLRPASSPTPTGTSPARNALPTSSVMGFSIPAEKPTATPPVPVSPTRK
ncbi:hypothetical protein CVT24_006922, partial [Panaeolus cyanescens]